jgi:hypothetical protein
VMMSAATLEYQMGNSLASRMVDQMVWMTDISMVKMTAAMRVAPKD